MNNLFTVISYNIWFEDTLNAERTMSLIKIINDTNPDIICLQEVRPMIYEFLLNTLTNHRYHFPKKFKKSYSCVVFSKYPIKKCLEYKFENSNMGRSLQIVKVNYPYHNITDEGVSVEKIDIVIGNTHFESVFKKKYINETKIEQFKSASSILDVLFNTYKNVVFCADTNVLLHEESQFNDSFGGWIDSWQEKGSDISRFTYDSDSNIYLKTRFTTIKYKSRVDRILYKSADLILEEFNILKGNSQIIEPSDHFGICCKFMVKKNDSPISE
jgi:exonuclease III